MKIRLKLYATLSRFLPAGAHRNAIDLNVDDNTSVRGLLTRHNVPMETCHLILINGVYTPPTTSDQAMLKDGDTVAVWPPVAGG